MILEKKKCLCGYILTEECEVYKKLSELLKYLPPQSYGVMVNNFIEQIERTEKYASNFVEDLDENYRNYLSIEEMRNNNKNELLELNDYLKNHDIQAVRETEAKYQSVKGKIKTNNFRLGAIEENIKNLHKVIKEQITERDSLLIDNERNNLIKKREITAMKLVEYFDEFLKEQEEYVRKHLQILVGDIFKRVIHKDYRIIFNERYEFNVIDENDITVPMSEGERQVTSISFITGIVNMAKDKKINDRFAEKTNYNYSEIYPVIMDSPFGSLDVEHRKNIAELVPELSDQTILFASSSQWRGEVEEAMRNKIGKEFILEYHKEKNGDFIEEYTKIIGWV